MSAGSSLRKGLTSHKTSGVATERQRGDIRSELDALSARLGAVIPQVNQAFKKINEKADELARVCAALTKLTGQQAVTEEIQRQHIEELNAESAAAGAIIEKAVAAGTMAPTDTITANNNIVVTTERQPDGTIRQPEFIRSALGIYVDEVKEKLLGKKVGDVVTMEDGSTITVVEVYQAVLKTEEVASDETSPYEESYDQEDETTPQGQV